MSATRFHAPLSARTATPPAARPVWFIRWLSSPWPYLWALDVIVSIFILRWAKTDPGYDPFGWLTWGWQTWHGALDLRGAPSWKPFTYAFTLPYALFGMRAEFWLWRVTELAGAIGGLFTGGLIAYRLVRRDEEPIWPALIAFAFAFIGLAMIIQYWHYILSSQSDPMLVTCVLLGFNQLLSKRYGWAMTFWVAAGLGRPEIWAILVLVGLWVFITQPRLRWLLIAEAAFLAFMWFIIPVISGAPWNIASTLAENSVRELHGNVFIGTIQRYADLTLWPVLASAAGTFVWATLRRDWRVLGLAAIPILWMIVEEYFTVSKGFAGVPRYMFEAGATTIVLAAVGIGWLARLAWGSRAGVVEHERLENDGRRLRGSVSAGDRSPLLTRGLAAVIGLVLIGFMVPYAKDAWDFEHTDIISQRSRSHDITMLGAAIKRAGGPGFVKSCGTPTVDVGSASLLAFDTQTSTAHIGYIPEKQIASGKPTVLFTGLFNGFAIHTFNLTGADAARCSTLDNAYYLVTAGHPGGEFIHLNH